MLIINDFFARNIEAVSFQMEIAKNALNGKIISAKRFFDQPILDKADTENSIFVYSPFIYNLQLIKNILFSKEKKALIYQEEPSLLKRFLFNLTKKDVFIAMYRQPTQKYIKYLKKFKKLKKVFVELENHRQILIDAGIPADKIVLTPTPSKLKLNKNTKIYDKSRITILFASWNNVDGMDTCYIRGLFWLVDCLEKHDNIYLNIILRDDNTKNFIEYIGGKLCAKRINLIRVNNDEELTKQFDNADFVVYFLLKQIIKDVPNSLIDGITRGKPIIMTNVLSFSNYVKEKQIGIVLEPNEKLYAFDIDRDLYKTLSENAFSIALNHTKENYAQILKDACDE